MTADERLKRIAAILETAEDGAKVRTHAFYDLHGVIVDLERTCSAERVTLATLRRVAGQLRCVQNIVEGTRNDPMHS
jgi:hypothetical protein